MTITEPKGEAVLDGALFSFSLGPDPEALLLLEARAENEPRGLEFRGCEKRGRMI